MAKDKKKNSNYKRFELNKAEDVLAVLGDLILSIMIDLEKYQQYQLELDALIDEYTELDEDNKTVVLHPVPENVFCNLNDKIMHRQFNMLKMIADENKSSFSYRTLRKIAVNMKFISDSLPEEASSILNEFLHIRNWSFHNSQSRLTAADEVMKNTIPKELSGWVSVERQLNPAVAYVYDFYHISFLLSLAKHMAARTKMTKTILEHMKNDYTILYNIIRPNQLTIFPGRVNDPSKVHFIVHKMPGPKMILDQCDMIAQVSMAIQKGKYDGSEEEFRKWTLYDKARR